MVVPPAASVAVTCARRAVGIRDVLRAAVAVGVRQPSLGVVSEELVRAVRVRSPRAGRSRVAGLLPVS